MALRVVCGVGEVMETLDSHMVLTSVDFPADGLPITATEAHFISKVYCRLPSVGITDIFIWTGLQAGRRIE